MVRGLGNDIIAVSRIETAIDRYGQKFLDRVFTISEQNYCSRYKESTRNYAGRFAAKEAIVKALGTGFRNGLGWLDIEILNDSSGKPIVQFSDKLNQQFGNPQMMLSISHCREFASAVAILL